MSDAQQVESGLGEPKVYAWDWAADFKEVSTFDIEEMRNYVLRPTEACPQVWCRLHAVAVTTGNSNRLDEMLTQVIEHQRSEHPRKV